ncbi:hypothetical protein [Peptostreptococcus faecalis]|uniref:hypothetical protein n=1 Tax=Peptostreptococcus faecalis TaxID=2045015 RepID=UPI000C7A994D|nr:hypothetical protein [Peptostreptococcus faecalis]
MEWKEDIEAIINILNKYLKLYGIEDSFSELSLEVKVEEHIRYVIEYCNREDYPSELNYVVAMRVLGDLLGSKFSSIADSSDDEKVVKQVSEGSTTVTFSDAGEKVSLDLIKSYKGYGAETIIKFRKIRWRR